jgi:hypothetical protein
VHGFSTSIYLTIHLQQHALVQTVARCPKSIYPRIIAARTEELNVRLLA